MKEEVGQKRLGYLLLVLSFVPFLYSLRFLRENRMFLFLGIGLLLWALAVLCIIREHEKRKRFMSMVVALVVVTISPMGFIYFEAYRGIAAYQNAPYLLYVVYEVISAFLFIGGITFLLRQLATKHRASK